MGAGVRIWMNGWVLEQARRECWDRERWRLYSHGHPLGKFLEGARRQSYRDTVNDNTVCDDLKIQKEKI